MKLINRDKLTPFDLQVLNMLALMPHKVVLGEKRMALPSVAMFKLTMLGMQTIEPDTPTTSYRHLSWRGQILVGLEHARLLEQTVPEPAQATAENQAAAQAKPGPGKMNPSASQLGMLQQAQAAMLQRRQADLMADITAMPPPRYMGFDIAADIQRRNLEQMQAMLKLPGEMIMSKEQMNLLRNAGLQVEGDKG